MRESLRALVVIMLLALPTLWLMRKPLTATIITPSNFQVRSRLWLGLTVALFAANSFWLVMGVTLIGILTYGRRDTNPLGLYCFLLFVTPPFHAAVSGFGGINNFIELDHLRLLSIVILLPAAVQLWTMSDSPKFFKMPADKYVLGYLLLLMAIQIPVTTVTDSLRVAFLLVIDTFLPYYVFSRALRQPSKLRDALASYVAACCLMAVLSLFEAGKGWLLYSSLPTNLNVFWNFGGYMVRDGGLRSAVSTGHPIVLGYVMAVGLGLHMSLRRQFPNVVSWRAMLVLLVAGVAASGSRGPWVGATALIIVAALLSPLRASNVVKLIACAGAVTPILMYSPVGPKIMALLPFVGNYDAGSVDYRQQLFEASWRVFKLNPWLGSPYYMANSTLEQLRQGEHIIDMVNSYLGVALVSGAVGLALFLGAFVSGAIGIVRRLLADPALDGESSAAGRALLAALTGTLVIIATTSSINAIPVVYWCLAGACTAFSSWPSVVSAHDPLIARPQPASDDMRSSSQVNVSFAPSSPSRSVLRRH